MDIDVPAPPSGDFFLARQPILNRAQQLVAFELLFRSAGAGDANVTDGVAATAAVIAHASQLGLEQVVGERLALINVDAVVLLSDFIRFLPNHKVILEILETVEASPEIMARVLELKQLGFKFALDDVITDSADVRKLLPLVDLVKVDIMGMAPEALARLAATLKASGKKLLAEKVETLPQFEYCLQLGFDYFQGYYFAKPVILTGKKIAPTELAIMQLLGLINSDADNGDIERSVKRDPLISLNLLRLVNTPAAGVPARIDSIGQALLVLGRRQLQRWLQILLYATPGEAAQFASPLLQLAITRGKLLELITEKLRPGQRAAADTGFTVGVMSLMDALFSMSMLEVLATVQVADEVRAALLERAGDFGLMLQLAEALENTRNDGVVLAQALRDLNLTGAELREIQLAAFEWANELTQGAS